jgi:FKBP-type peptidyl-prolyl cis-trans isomerase
MNRALVSILVLAVFATIALVAAAPKKLEKLQIGVIQQGNCERRAKSGDTIRVHYTGRLLSTGAKFDSSLDRNDPFEFRLGQRSVIQGWDQGLIGSCTGQKLRLKIPSAMAYGERGAGANIPPNSDLVFDIEVIEIK